jgi:hypothetical protein
MGQGLKVTPLALHLLFILIAPLLWKTKYRIVGSPSALAFVPSLPKITVRIILKSIKKYSEYMIVVANFVFILLLHLFLRLIKE